MRKRVNESWKIKACVELMVPCVQNFFTDRYPITHRDKKVISFHLLTLELNFTNTLGHGKPYKT